jgi:ATP phosphoribosyltransferase regulatory subunit
MLLERWQQIPPGMRDLLPDETARVRAVSDRIMRQMARWGYREVTTPTLEYLDVLVHGEGGGAGDRVFKLVDRRGEVLALRPEMTTPVARLVATRLAGEPLPMRLAYAGQVFRGAESGSGHLREFPQVGCELIGSRTPEADAEIVALAVESLAAAGLEQFSVSLGHVGFLRETLTGLGLQKEEEAAVRGLLYQKDFVGLRSLLERHRAAPKSVRALLALPTLRGPAAIAEARRLVDTPEGQHVVSDLTELQGMLDAYGVGGAVTVDLSIIRDFDYYTGIVFEGHTTALGLPLLGGGRYDRLMGGFGAGHPATGFAVRVDRVLAAGGTGKDTWAPDVVLAFVDGGRDAALACARDLRRHSLVVAVDVLGRPWEDVARDALARGAGYAILVRGGSAVVRDSGGREREVAVAELQTLGPARGGST